ncbi:hypothetical protein HZC08_01980, partial [Candidatus Micrarchaeota archaeon]|nr:hypothetical protein [Candidatus Micrarchaeota archaeon]
NYQWNCSIWSECLFPGKQTRTCINFGTCPVEFKTPGTEKICTYLSPKVESGEHLEKENPSEPEEKTYAAPENPVPQASKAKKEDPNLPLALTATLVIAVILSVFILLGKIRKVRP